MMIKSMMTAGNDNRKTSEQLRRLATGGLTDEDLRAIAESGAFSAPFPLVTKPSMARALAAPIDSAGLIDLGAIIDGDPSLPATPAAPAEWEATRGRDTIAPGWIWSGFGYVNGQLDFPRGMRTRGQIKRYYENDLPGRSGVVAQAAFNPTVVGGSNYIAGIFSDTPEFVSAGVYIEVSTSPLNFTPYNMRISFDPTIAWGGGLTPLAPVSHKRGVVTSRDLSVRVCTPTFAFTLHWGYLETAAAQAVASTELANAQLVSDAASFAYFGATTLGVSRGVGVGLVTNINTLTGNFAALANSSYMLSYTLGGLLR